MQEDLIRKFGVFSDAQLWVMVTCFKNPQHTLLYQHALAALEKSNPEMAEKLRKRRIARMEKV